MENLNDSERMQNIVTERLLFFLMSLIRAGSGEDGAGCLESVLTVFYLIHLEKHLD